MQSPSLRDLNLSPEELNKVTKKKEVLRVMKACLKIKLLIALIS